jgi:hypothetical protein
MNSNTLRVRQTALLACILLITSCSHKLIKYAPEPVYDTSDITITCDATEGNKGLLDFKKNVYVHVGLITNKSFNRNDWKFVLFDWGSTDARALATPAGDNKWTYSIKNIRQFFKVPNDEKITDLVILFRAGECFDSHCKVLRNADESDIYIPVSDKTVLLSDATIK